MFKNIYLMVKNLLIVLILCLVGLILTVNSTNAGRHPRLNHVKYVTQLSNSLTSYINYHRFNFVNNHNYTEPNNYSQNYNRTVNPHRHLNFAGGNQRMNFKPYAELQNIDSQHNPQSIALTNHGTLYVAHRVDNHGEVQILRYQIQQKRHHLLLTHYTAGPIFRGGHGQGLAYNPKSHQLWMLTNEQGAANFTSIQEISTKNLNPFRQINFYMYPYPMGDVLTFDNHGNAYTCTRTFNPLGGANSGSLKLYKGKVGPNGVHFHMVQGLRHAPGMIMQNISYDPDSNRIYFVTDGELMSVPAKNFSHISPKRVRVTKLTGHYEFEDLAFYHGHGYLLLHYPSELLRN